MVLRAAASCHLFRAAHSAHTGWYNTANKFPPSGACAPDGLLFFVPMECETMKTKIYINDTDKSRLSACIAQIEEFGQPSEQGHAAQLKAELERAIVVKDVKKTPPDVITMRTRARLVDSETGKAAEYTLVYPTESDPMERRVSVLAPMGVAMLGCRKGSTFEARLPSRTARYQVEEILYQPEAAGDFHL